MTRNALARLYGRPFVGLPATLAVVQAGAFHARRDYAQRVMV